MELPPAQPGQGRAGTRAEASPEPFSQRILRGAAPATAAAPAAAGAGPEPCQKHLNEQTHGDAIRPSNQPGTLREAAQGSGRRPGNGTALPLLPAVGNTEPFLIPEDPSLIPSPRCLTLILGPGVLPSRRFPPAPLPRPGSSLSFPTGNRARSPAFESCPLASPCSSTD